MADTARATLIAALVDAPPETLRVIDPIIPQRRSGGNVAVVIALIVDSTGAPDPESMTVVLSRGDLSFTRNACRVVQQNRFQPINKPGPFLNLAVFVRFVPPMPPEFNDLYQQARTKLERMSTVERRDFLLDKGCRRFR